MVPVFLSPALAGSRMSGLRGLIFFTYCTPALIILFYPCLELPKAQHLTGGLHNPPA